MNRLITVSAISAFFVLSGCSQTEMNEPQEAQASSLLTDGTELGDKPKVVELTDSKTEKIMTITGTIVYKTFEGGFYAFIADDGRQFTPYRLSTEFRQDGLRLTLTGEVMKGMVTTTQFGEVLNIIEVLDYDKAALKPSSPINQDDL